MHYLYLECVNEIQNGVINITDPLLEIVHSSCLTQNHQDQQQSIIKTTSLENQNSLQKQFLIFEDLMFKINLLKCSNILFQKDIIKSPLIFGFAMPSQYDIKNYIDNMLQLFHKDIRSIRILYEPGADKRKRFSFVILFKDQVSAEQFYNQYNCFQLSQQEELLYLVYINKITFFNSKELSLQQLLQQQQQDFLISLPTCPVCIERIDTSITGLNFQPIDKLFIYDIKDRWLDQKNSCMSCSQIQRQSSQSPRSRQNHGLQEIIEDNKNKLSCKVCDQQADLWICLVCGHLGCGRYKFGHAEQHFITGLKNHSFALELETERIWYYIGDTFVHRILLNQKQDKQIMIVHLPDANKQDEDPNCVVTDKAIPERVDSAIWELCYVISQEMEVQRKFFQQRIEEEEKNLLEGEQVKAKEIHIKELQEKIQQEKKRLEEYEKENEKLKKKTRILDEKIKQTVEKNDQFQLFSKSMKDNILHFKAELQKPPPFSQELYEEQKKLTELQRDIYLQYEKLN